MNMNPNSRANAALVVAMIALVVGSFLLGARVNTPAAPATDTIGVQAMAPIRFTGSGSKMTFMSGSTLEVQAGTTESHANSVTFSGSLVEATESITPTNGGTITPTKVLVTLTPAGALGTALGACTTGQRMVLYNSVNANVVVSDTGNALLAGDQTLGQYDALPLSCFSSKWVQTGPVSAN